MLRVDKTTYISVDIEATGPVPGLYSMISLGAAAFDRDGNLLDKILINFQELEGSKQDPATMQFWQENQLAYFKTLENPYHAVEGTQLFKLWYSKFDNPVFVCMPAKFDGLFVYWYLQTFIPGLGFTNTPDIIDIKTLAMVALGQENPHFAGKRFWKKAWKDKNHIHNHISVDDAVEQGQQFIKILDYLAAQRAS